MSNTGSNLRPGWADTAGKLAGLAERGGGPVEGSIGRRPAGWAPRKPLPERMTKPHRKRPGTNQFIERHLDAVLGSVDEEGDE